MKLPRAGIASGAVVAAAAGVVLMEFADFPMMRKLLLTVRDRAESAVA